MLSLHRLLALWVAAAAIFSECDAAASPFVPAKNGRLIACPLQLHMHQPFAAQNRQTSANGPVAAVLVVVYHNHPLQHTFHDLEVFSNLLKSGNNPSVINQVWVSDMTYIRTDEGWQYLCTVLDLFSRRIVGFALSKRIDRHLAIAAFENAMENRRPKTGFIFHSDRGCQYASHEFRNAVGNAGGRQSMSAAGNPYDNASAESFFKTLKVEWLERMRFKTRQEATKAVREYMLYYNRRRLHSSLGYQSPVNFEMGISERPLAS